MRDRYEAMTALYASIAHRCPISMRAYVDQAVTMGFEVIPIRDGHEIIGAVLTKGAEVHLGVKRRPQHSQRRLIHEVLEPIIKRYGYAMTLVKHDNPAGRVFCRRLGFEAARSTEDATHYICTRATHA